MREYRTWETPEHVVAETRAAERLSREWCGQVVATSQFAPFDRVLTYDDGRTAAIVEIKVRNFTIDYFAAHRYWVSWHKVKTLKHHARQRSCTPIIMVACIDDDYFIDLRDESGMTIERRTTTGNYADAQTGERLKRVEDVCVFAGDRLIPLWALRRTLV